MITLEPVSVANVEAFKTTRLRALQDTPTAFGSTYARESVLTDEQWLERITKWETGKNGAFFLARNGDEYVGIIGGYFEPEDRSRAWLVSMWVAESYRRSGVGKKLVDAILDWARSQNAAAMLLECVNTNERAMVFYKKLGFGLTGNTSPYPNDPSLIEHEMIFGLS